MTFVLAALLVVGAAPAARAYLDPGGGSMLVQLLAGGVAGVIVLVKLYWKRIKDKLRGQASTNSTKAPPSGS